MQDTHVFIHNDPKSSLSRTPTPFLVFRHTVDKWTDCLKDTTLSNKIGRHRKSFFFNIVTIVERKHCFESLRTGSRRRRFVEYIYRATNYVGPARSCFDRSQPTRCGYAIGVKKCKDIGFGFVDTAIAGRRGALPGLGYEANCWELVFDRIERLGRSVIDDQNINVRKIVLNKCSQTPSETCRVIEVWDYDRNIQVHDLSSSSTSRFAQSVGFVQC